MDEPHVTHEPHVVCVIYKHDCRNVLVAMAICNEGRCRPHPTRGDIITRYTAAGIEAGHYPLDPNLRFWCNQEALRTMASLKLAQYEGRQGVVDWARARLIDIARNGPCAVHTHQDHE